MLLVGQYFIRHSFKVHNEHVSLDEEFRFMAPYANQYEDKNDQLAIITKYSLYYRLHVVLKKSY